MRTADAGTASGWSAGTADGPILSSSLSRSSYLSAAKTSYYISFYYIDITLKDGVITSARLIIFVP